MTSVVFSAAALLAFMLCGPLAGCGIALWLGARLRAERGPRVLMLTLFGFAGLVIGTFFGVVRYSYIKKEENEATQGWKLRAIVVARSDIQPGARLTFDMISQRSIPEQFVPDEAVRPDEAERVINQVVAGPLHEMEPLLWTHLCTTADR